MGVLPELQVSNWFWVPSWRVAELGFQLGDSTFRTCSLTDSAGPHLPVSMTMWARKE